jgi:phosphotransferase system IIA component
VRELLYRLAYVCFFIPWKNRRKIAGTKGKYFKGFVRIGDEVHAGQRLIEFNRKAVKDAGYDTITLVIITNSDDYKEIVAVTGKPVSELEKVIEVR